MYKRIAIGISSIALSLALIVSGLILQSPSIAFAQSITVDSNSVGLVVIPADGKFFELNNMGPGDGYDSDIANESSTITISNNYTEAYEVFLTTRRDPLSPVQIYDLYDQLRLEVRFRGATLQDKTQLMKGFANSVISLGTFAPGQSQIMDLAVALPEELGNEYQGTSVSVIWEFRAEVPEPGPGPGPGPGPDDDDDEDEPEVVPEEPVPLAVVEPVPEEIIPEETVPLAVPEVEEAIEEEPVPLAVPKLPKTGGMAPIFFYSAGAVLLGAGVVILRRKDDDDEK